MREQWIVPTFISARVHSASYPLTASWQSRDSSNRLIFVNNWLQEGPTNLHFANYQYPPSVEIPTLDKRRFYGSFPPGATIQLYGLFKALDFTGLVPNIYQKRGIQLLLITLYKYLLHFLTTILLCAIVFFVCRQLDFDHLNSTLLGVIPAIVQFHNAGSLFWNHFLYHEHTIVLLPFVLCILLEVLRIVCTQSKVLFLVKFAQPLVMFWGMFTDWLFAFVILTIYIMRIIRKEIDLPVSLQSGLRWVRKSFLFFAPSSLAIAIWIYQIDYYSENVVNVVDGGLFDTPVSATSLPLLRNLLFKMGVMTLQGDDVTIWQRLFYYKMSLFTIMRNDYGISALLMIYSVFYLVIRNRKITNSRINIAAYAYLMLFVPALVQHLFFAEPASHHLYSSVIFTPSLSISFVFAPIFVFQMLKRSYLIPAMDFLNKKCVTIVALAGLISSTLYGYTQIYHKSPVTKMFTPPDYKTKSVGDFVAGNTNYFDVVFSQDYYFFSIDAYYTVFLSGKVIRYSHSLDHVYQKTKSIEQDFTIRILYYEHRRKEIKQLSLFLKDNSFPVDDIQDPKIGGLLTFNGKQFLAWYEQVHECDVYPQRCNGGT